MAVLSQATCLSLLAALAEADLHGRRDIVGRIVATRSAELAELAVVCFVQKDATTCCTNKQKGLHGSLLAANPASNSCYKMCLADSCIALQHLATTVQLRSQYNTAQHAFFVLFAQVSGLRPGRGYSFRVRAQNAQGQGPWSQPLQATTAADIPGPPSQPVCSKRTAAGVTVKWEAPEQDNGVAVVSYR